MSSPPAAPLRLHHRAARVTTTAAAAGPGARPKVLFVTPESGDFLQAGGLGEVSAALPRALARECDARVLLPAYRPALSRVAAIEIVAHLPGAAAIPPCSIGRQTLAGGLIVYLVLCSELYDRDGSPYVDANGAAFGDNAIRFARLSLAAAELAERGIDGWRPDVLHLNDWPSALTAAYLRWRGARTPTLLSIHNLAHQGQFDPAQLNDLAIPPAAYCLEGVEFYGRISFLKAGLVYASHATTVSQTYADEIVTPEFGCGLNGVIAERAREGRLSAIRNGVDESWNPRADTSCPYRFDAQGWKARYADFVRGVFRLSLAGAPLFVFVARLVHQKGVDLMLEASETIAERGGQVIIIGRGEPEAERAAMALAARRPGAIGVRIGFEASEARAVLAAADFLLMPSRFEPCGLSQMHAQRFGALPIARRTGGLAETIEDGRTGFLFDRPDAQAFGEAINAAFALYASPRDLQTMRDAAMAKDFGWSEAAAAYGALYRKLEADARAAAEASGDPPRSDARALQRLALAGATSLSLRARGA